MTDYRLWIALLLAGCLWSSGVARAQDSSGSTSGGASSGTSGGASNNGTSGGASNGTSGAPSNGTSGGASNGTAGGTSDGSSGAAAGGSGTGASTSFGNGPAGTGTPAGGRPVLPFSTPGSTPGAVLPFIPPGNTPGNSGFGAPGSSDFGAPPLPGGSSSFPPGTPGNPSSSGNGAAPGTPDTTGGNGANGNGGAGGAGPVPLPPTGTEPPPGPGNSGAASAFGGGFSGGVTPPAQALPSTFTMPAAYGQSSQTFSAGIGHISKPRVHFSASVQFGFDDNVEGTPTKSTFVPAVVQQVEVSAPVAPVTVTLPLPPPPITSIILGQPPPPQRFRTITFDGKPAVFKNETVSPAVPAQARIESFVMRANAAMLVQFATSQTFFNMNVTGGIDAYQNRPGGNIDPTGSFSLSFIHRITPRLQFSATASASYTSQPSVATINTAAGDVGSYLSIGSKFDLSYRWSPRFSTVSSLSLLGQEYQSSAEKISDNYDTVFGTEFRYLWSPRLTLLTEVRYDFQTFPDNAPRDSRTLYLLLGGEMALSSRISASVRLGESFDSFTSSNGQATTPYAETTLSWRYCPTGYLSWNSRYGFETPPDAQSTVKGVHTGISILQALSKKLRVSAGATYVTRTTVTGLTPSNVAVTSGTQEQDTIDFSLGFEYTVSPRLTLSASYIYDDVLNTGGIGNYYHNRMFFGFTYGY